MDRWYQKTGPQGDVVISTRIRFARNLNDFPFPCKLNPNKKTEVVNLVNGALGALNKDEKIRGLGLRFIDVGELSKSERISLVERHLISPKFIEKTGGRGLISSQDETVSVMINEEDHIRLQVIKEGLNFDESYPLADLIDDILDKKLSFAFDEKLGYLTQCPTNLGTGMRASVMLHLPALRESGKMAQIASSISKLGLVIRGLYGEGSEPKADLYQLSNQVTLGFSEKASIKNLEDIAMQLIMQERSARSEIVKHIEIVDLIHRSYGVLANARLVSESEFMKLISNVRLGVATGEIKNIPLDLIDSLIINVQPAMLEIREGKNLSATHREQLRADLIRQSLTTKNS
ncbi:MAG: protein arginine kinase [Clostridia bacterium]|nr:protein arginine kinase [Clostridia bacterium]